MNDIEMKHRVLPPGGITDHPWRNPCGCGRKSDLTLPCDYRYDDFTLCLKDRTSHTIDQT